MSWQGTAFVKLLKPEIRITRAEKIVLFVIADYHRLPEDDAYPTVETIARQALMSVRQAQRCIQHTEELDILMVTRSDGRNPNHYTFNWKLCDRPEILRALGFHNTANSSSNPDKSTANPARAVAAEYRRLSIEKVKDTAGQRAVPPYSRLIFIQKSKPSHLEFKASCEEARQAFWERFNEEPSWGTGDFRQVAELFGRRNRLTRSEFAIRYRRFLNSPDSFHRKQAGSLKFFATNFDKFMEELFEETNRKPRRSNPSSASCLRGEYGPEPKNAI